MKDKNFADKVLRSLEELKDAKELLDDITSYYRPYDRDFKYMPDDIHQRIRQYMEFDDSE